MSKKVDSITKCREMFTKLRKAIILNMRETICTINKQLIGHRIYLLWYNVRIFFHIVYLLFQIFSIPLLGMYLGISDLNILCGLCLLMFYYNFRMLPKIFGVLDDEYNEIKSKRNELRAIICDKVRLKKLLKKSEQKTLDYFERNELYYILIGIGVDEEEAKELVDIMK